MQAIWLMERNYRKRLLFSILLLCMMLTVGAQKLTVEYNGETAKVSGKKTDAVAWTIDGAHVSVMNHDKSTPLQLLLKGTTANGSLTVASSGGAVLTLDNVSITNRDGAPLHIKKKFGAQVIAKNGTHNQLIIEACIDTAHKKSAALYCKGDLTLSGKGALDILARGDGCKGINAKANLTISDLTLNVQTTGDNLGPDTTNVFPFGGGGGAPMGPPPGFGGDAPDMGMGRPPFHFNPDSLPEEVKQQFEEMRKHFEEMGKQFEAMRNDSTQSPFGGGGGMPMGKQKYLSTPKGIKAAGLITIQSGKVNVSTAHAGGEGIEGKGGVVINGGTVAVDAIDDGINANAQIVFNGGTTTVISRSNDAVDANFNGEGAITIAGGTTYAFSQIGPPEEGFDCDFSSILVTGGTAFSIGAGMGDIPSMPTEETAKQPVALLVGLNVTEGEAVEVCDEQGHQFFSFKAPFNFQRSSSIITCPQFQVGKTYIVKSGRAEHQLQLNSQLTAPERSMPQFPFSFPQRQGKE